MSARSLVALLSVIMFLDQTLRAQEPVTFNIRGVTAGVTRHDELKQNGRWGEPLGETLQSDGSIWAEYRFWAWQKVTAVIANDVVQTIDAVPPDRVPAAKLSESLQLGELTAIAAATELPAAALVGPDLSPNWKVFRCSTAAGVLIFAEPAGDAFYAKRLRMYSQATPQRAYLGVRIHVVSPAEAELAGLKEPAGIYVEYVTPESPGARAGILAGDIILEACGERPDSTEGLMAIIHRQPIGTKQPFTITRDGTQNVVMVTLRPRPDHMASFQSGQELERQGRFREALRMYTNAIQLHAGEPVYFQGRAGCLRQLGRAEEALQDANEAIRLNEQSIMSYLERARCLTALGRYDAARADCQRAITMDATRAEAYAVRGNVFVRQQLPDQAFADLQQAIQLNAELESPYLSRGALYFGQQKYDQALADYSRAITLNPRAFDAQHMRGWCYIRKASYRLARESFQQLIDTLPNHDHLYLAFHGLGVVHLEQHDNSQAVTAFSEAVNRNPTYSPAYEARARAYRALGEHEKEAADLQKVAKPAGVTSPGEPPVPSTPLAPPAPAP